MIKEGMSKYLGKILGYQSSPKDRSVYFMECVQS